MTDQEHLTDEIMFERIAELETSNAELLAALYRAQAILNPLSGFLKKWGKYIEGAREQIRAAIERAGT